jgi:hypothetical protein
MGDNAAMASSVNSPPESSQPQKAPRRGGGRWRVVRLALLATVLALAATAIYDWRIFYSNFGTVVEGKVYRSARPRPQRLREWADQYKLRSVLVLAYRDGEGDYAEVAAVAQECGLKVLYAPMPSEKLPSHNELRRAITTLEQAELPVLIHCRAGAERTGVVSMMAAMLYGGEPYDQAREQLSARYLHLTHHEGHVEWVPDMYEQYCRQKGIGTGGWQQFRQWVFTGYNSGEATPPPATTQGDAAGEAGADAGGAVAPSHTTATTSSHLPEE